MPSRFSFSILLIFLSSALLSGCGGGGSGSSSQGDGGVVAPAPAPAPAPDRTPPVITLAGSANVQHEQGTDYIDPGATAADAVDGPVAVVATGSVGRDAGTYRISYAATDAAGNQATATRTVMVADTKPPIVILIGAAVLDQEQGAPFTDPGAAATDAVDGSVTVATTGTVGSAVGTYLLTYSATDRAGNSASVTRTVIVRAPPNGDYTIIAYGAGSISDTINPASYRCVVDNGNWIYNAGVVKPAIQGCNATTGIPTGTPTRLVSPVDRPGCGEADTDAQVVGFDPVPRGNGDR
jgi:endo-1,3(4)-beta-glucanase